VDRCPGSVLVDVGDEGAGSCDTASIKFIAAILCFVIAAIGAFVTAAFLLLALTPQDSGASATGDWEAALGPGAVAVVATCAGVWLLRSDR
jgi:hypothetical protein